jgi:hypothetical protein
MPKQIAHEELAQLALLTAEHKAGVFRTIRSFLYAAERECRSFQECHNTWSNDPEVEKLRENISKLSRKVPSYHPTPLNTAAGITEEQYEYYNGNTIWDLRQADLATQGITFDEDQDDIDDIPWEDPLDTYKRLTGWKDPAPE